MGYRIGLGLGLGSVGPDWIGRGVVCVVCFLALCRMGAFFFFFPFSPLPIAWCDMNVPVLFFF